MEAPVLLRLEVGAKLEEATRDEITRRLMRELRDSSIASAETVQEPGRQDGTKAVDASAVGILAVTVLPAVLPELIDFLKDWVMRANDRTVIIKRQVGDRSVEVEYDVGRISEEQIRHLLNVVGSYVEDEDLA